MQEENVFVKTFMIHSTNINVGNFMFVMGAAVNLKQVIIRENELAI
ncbi:hypothetical protein [Sporosarcina aquimarina]|nr:hypothetical protein [Sporosarcina aquimarina]MBY0223863.1 hypothetical protein [Sporosarcina aquimarina]